jgi:predicted MPP superfamily phosphohydrolase
MNRRSFLKKCFTVGLAGTLAAPAYSHFYERKWIEIKQVPLSFAQLPNAFHGLRLLHFTDVHLGYYFDEYDLKELIDTINDLSPDLICFTGDFVESKVDILERSISLLKELKAPFGKFAVLGNHDYWENADGVADAIMAADFTLLRNDSVRVERGNDHIVVAGIDDVLYGEPDLDITVSNIQTDDFIILLAHEPDFADIASQYPIQLQLSGHSHGGQIRFPMLGAVVTPPYGQKYPDRLYQVEQLKLYTSRGVGTTGVPFRMLCRPELTLIELRRE